MKILVISCSLNTDSRSAALAQLAPPVLATLGARAELVDLRGLDLPLCDAGSAYGAPDAVRVKQQVEAADAILLAVPVYNFDVNAAAKNLVELTGKSWAGKTVGFLCTAGGRGSYMSVMSLANSLMLDFRCLIVPRFVYATGDDFDADNAVNTQIAERVEELCVELHRITAGLISEDGASRASRPLG